VTAAVISIHQEVARLRATTSNPAALALAAADLDDGAGRGKRVAAALKISFSALDRARRVLHSGRPELIASVRAGETSLSAADRIVNPNGNSGYRNRNRNLHREGGIVVNLRREAAVTATRVGEEAVNRFLAAVDGLTSLPLPADIAAALPHDSDLKTRIAHAATYLKEICRCPRSLILSSATAPPAIRVHVTRRDGRRAARGEPDQPADRPGHGQPDRQVRSYGRPKWKFNGDTLKISPDRDILDGQHRLWAVIEAKRPVETLLAFGVSKDAFDTIDTLRKFRTLGDTIALEGQVVHRAIIGAALSWLIRYERGVLETYREPVNRVENSDIKEAFRANPNIVKAIERTAVAAPAGQPRVDRVLSTMSWSRLRTRSSVRLMVETLLDPSRTKLTHPFYLLRAYLASDLTKKEAVKTIALAIKAANAAYRSAELKTLEWSPQGRTPDRFPILDVRNLRKAEAG
jgi:hypothetical protein